MSVSSRPASSRRRPPSDEWVAFGSYLKELRELRGANQRKWAASMFGRDRRTLGRWEKGAACKAQVVQTIYERAGELGVTGAQYRELVDRFRAAAGVDAARLLPRSLAAMPQPSARAGDRALLEQFRYVSKMAAVDAATLSGADGLSGITPPYATGDGFELTEALYVPRVAETAVETHLGGDTGRLVAVVGEGGAGKTSLLWRLATTAPTSQERWLVKAPWLFDVHRALSRPDELATAVRAAHDEGQSVVILLDTVDLVLHDDADRDALLLVLASLADLRCDVVVTTRPQEARHLRPASPTAVQLGNYTDGEFAVAVPRYAAVFGREGAAQPQDYVERMNEIVARGMPARDLCLSPLLLRMLFEVYQPHELSGEIHTYQLYRDYWRLRVERDGRAGMLDTDSSEDLSSSAVATALVMLAEGTPDVHTAQLSARIARFGGSAAEASLLVRRGVLQPGSDATTSFFHQTFLEHAAGHGFADCGDRTAIVGLRDRIFANPDDLFVLPVYEQALLAIDETGATNLTNSSIVELIRSGRHTLQDAAISVYCHRISDDATVAGEIQRLLHNTDTPVVNRFLAAAANCHKDRLGGVYDHLDVVWERNRWPEQRHLLDLLRRLTPRAPRFAHQFVDRHDLVGFARRQRRDLDVDGQIVTVVEACAATHPQWAVETLLELYGDANRKRNSTTVQVRIVDALTRHLNRVADPALFRKVESGLAPHLNDQIPVALQTAFGELFAQHLVCIDASIRDALHAIEDASIGWMWRVRLYGIAGWLLKRNPDDVRVALEHVSAIDNEQQWEWFAILVASLLAGRVISTESNPTSASQIAPLNRTLVAREWIHAQLASPHRSGHTPWEKLVFTALRQSLIQSEQLGEILDLAVFNNSDAWTAPHRTTLLAAGIAAGNPGALQLFERILRTPRRDQHVYDRVVSDLVERAQTEPTAFDPALRLALAAKDTTRLLRLLRQAERQCSTLAKHQKRLIELRDSGLSHSGARHRRNAINLWRRLADLEIIEPPDATQMLTLLRDERDRQVRLHILESLRDDRYIGASRQIFDELHETVAAQDANAKALNVDPRIFERTRLVLVHAATRGPARFADPDKIWSLATAEPVSVARLEYLAALVDQLARESVDVAIDILERLGETMPTLTNTAQRAVIASIRGATTRLFERSSIQQCRRLIELMAGADRFFCRLIIDTGCRARFEDIRVMLDLFTQRDDCTSEARDLVRRQKHQRERTRGGNQWRDLYDTPLGR